MKFEFKNTLRGLVKGIGFLLITLSVAQCCSTKQLQVEAPITFGEVYYKNWVAGVKGGGSGTNLFVEVTSNTIQLDSVYFRDRVSKLENKPDNLLLYIGRFLSQTNTEELYQITDNSIAEYKRTSNNPFNLKADECVVSYKIEGKTKYYKLINIIQKPSEEYPSVKEFDGIPKQ